MVDFIPIYRYFAIYDVTKIPIYRYIGSKGLHLNGHWPRVAPLGQVLYILGLSKDPWLEQNMKLIPQGGLHNYDIDDTHTCPVLLV